MLSSLNAPAAPVNDPEIEKAVASRTSVRVLPALTGVADPKSRVRPGPT